MEQIWHSQSVIPNFQANIKYFTFHIKGEQNPERCHISLFHDQPKLDAISIT